MGKPPARPRTPGRGPGPPETRINKPDSLTSGPDFERIRANKKMPRRLLVTAPEPANTSEVLTIERF